MTHRTQNSVPTLYAMGYGSWKDTKQRMARMIRGLQDAGVHWLVDVRHSPCASDPGSTGHYAAKDWNLQVSSGLEPQLREAGIEYLWLVELGNPQKRDPSMSVLKWQLATCDEKWPVNRGLGRLAELVRTPSVSCCILCACSEYTSCHRRVIAEALADRHFAGQLRVIDIQASGCVECVRN